MDKTSILSHLTYPKSFHLDKMLIRAYLAYLESLRGEMKKSRFKIWLRAFLFVQFSALFSLYFFHDIGNGYFNWMWVAPTFLLFVPVGFLMSRIVTMKADLELRAVTLSLDHVYLSLIWLLVIAKLNTFVLVTLFHVQTPHDFCRGSSDHRHGIQAMFAHAGRYSM